MRSLLRRVTSWQTGDIQWTLVSLASLSGLQEPEPGWLLANGAVVPSSGLSPAGYQYAPLFAELGTGYGATPGTLPPLTNGRGPVPAGPSIGRGVQGGASDVQLGWGNAPAHNLHSIDVWYPTGPDDGAGNVGFCFQSGNFQFPLKTNVWNMLRLSDVQGGSGGVAQSHENMPPYVVVEALLVRL